jgi:hypothetical protein
MEMQKIEKINQYTVWRQLGTYQEISPKLAANNEKETSQTLQTNGSSDDMLQLDRFRTESKQIND